MFDMDGDGEIDEFDEELTDYELQMMEDEIIFEEMEGRQFQEAGQEDRVNSCGTWIEIASRLLDPIL